MCLPTGLLYMRLVLGLAASDNRVGPQQSLWLARLSIATLALFFVVQVICARCVQNFLPRRQSVIGKAGQYIVVLAMCILFSLTGAIVLEALGLNVFLRARFR